LLTLVFGSGNPRMTNQFFSLIYRKAHIRLKENLKSVSYFPAKVLHDTLTMQTSAISF